MQIVPELAKVARKVTVFQRTPHWILPRGDYEISNWRKTLYRYWPFWQRYWRRRYVDANETEYISNNFAGHEENRKLQQAALDMMREQLPDQPALWDQLTPRYPVGGKRVVVSDFFFPALARPNVQLETRPIQRVDGHTVWAGDDETTHDAADAADTQYDLLVCATGFRATDFLHPLRIVGRQGRVLGDVWKDGARAYRGTSAEDMPNFAMVLGPNTGLLHNSFILMIEAQSRYINGLIRPVLEARRRGGTLSLTPRREPTDTYNAALQHRLQDFAVNNAQCTNWYKTGSGRVTNLWPGTVLEFQQLMENVDCRDFEAAGSLKHMVQDQPSYKVGRVVEEGGFLERLSWAQTVALGTGVMAGGLFLHRLITFT